MNAEFSPDHIHTTPDGRHFRHGDSVEVNGEGEPMDIDLVTHNGKRYSLADLAHYMEHDEREAIHSQVDTDTAEVFWAAFVERFPASADHLAEITRAR